MREGKKKGREKPGLELENRPQNTERDLLFTETQKERELLFGEEAENLEGVSSGGSAVGSGRAPWAEERTPFLNSLRSAFALFSMIPMGRVAPAKAAFMFVFFPLVGAVLGGMFYGLCLAGKALLLGDVFMGAALTALPIFCTGGIHLDGWMDVGDALGSWQGKETRLEILEDSHVGAFAVIRLAGLLLLQLAAFSEIWGQEAAVAVMAISFVFSRCLSGLGAVLFPKAKDDGMLAEAARTSAGLVPVILLLALGGLAAVQTYVSPILGGGAILASLVSFFWYRHVAEKNFGGITGDLNGYFLCLCETLVALVLAVLCRIF